MKGLLVVLAALVAACGGGALDGSGACVKELSGRPDHYCLNFRNQGSRTGESICTDQRGDWLAGITCQSLGYTKECRPNSWFKPSSACV
ncbi:MAG: hypothetical protein JNJ54_32160 [Myxococcaceae bacterium]|nr:hypothetical protein [Myxococcaceae bacterium]